MTMPRRRCGELAAQGAGSDGAACRALTVIDAEEAESELMPAL
jgi:hypothetical protein